GHGRASSSIRSGEMGSWGRGTGSLQYNEVGAESPRTTMRCRKRWRTRKPKGLRGGQVRVLPRPGASHFPLTHKTIELSSGMTLVSTCGAQTSDAKVLG